MKRSECLTRQVVAAAKAHPNLTSYELADLCRTSPNYVATACSREGIALPGRKHGPFSKLSAENIAWLRAEAERTGVLFAEMINAIVTDARLEAQD